MGKVSEMESTIRELRDAAASINSIADYLTGIFMTQEEPETQPEPAPVKEPAMTFEQVRAILADKSRDGFTAQVRELLQKYGGNKLSELDPACYKALVADAEGLSHAT